MMSTFKINQTAKVSLLSHKYDTSMSNKFDYLNWKKTTKVLPDATMAFKMVFTILDKP